MHILTILKPNRYVIRLARIDDLDLLTTIEAEAATRFEAFGMTDIINVAGVSLEHFGAAQMAERLWVATDAKDKPIGFALADVVGECAHLEELDVLPDYGRRGIGSALVNTVHQWAIRSGFAAITLTTMADIPWNRPFYEKLGYEVIDKSELSEPLCLLLAAESERGLRSEERVVMMHRFVNNE